MEIESEGPVNQADNNEKNYTQNPNKNPILDESTGSQGPQSMSTGDTNNKTPDESSKKSEILKSQRAMTEEINVEKKEYQ